jgi:hypothetical protein
MEQQKLVVQEIKDLVNGYQEYLNKLKMDLKREEDILVEICSKSGHDYVLEEKNEYHSFGHYKVCKHCGYFRL